MKIDLQKERTRIHVERFRGKKSFIVTQKLIRFFVYENEGFKQRIQFL